MNYYNIILLLTILLIMFLLCFNIILSFIYYCKNRIKIKETDNIQPPTIISI
jgi:hypothetical protein